MALISHMSSYSFFAIFFSRRYIARRIKMCNGNDLPSIPSKRGEDVRNIYNAMLKITITRVSFPFGEGRDEVIIVQLTALLKSPTRTGNYKSCQSENSINPDSNNLFQFLFRRCSFNFEDINCNFNVVKFNSVNVSRNSGDVHFNSVNATVIP